MRLLVTGICGFVGSALTRTLLEMFAGLEVVGIDNLIRPGSELNRRALEKIGCRVFHGDVRLRSDLEQLPIVDWVIDAAANPSVSAGVDGSTSSRQVVEHNLLGTINILEYCRHSSAGLVLLSTSRVYSIPALGSLPLVRTENRFALQATDILPVGISRRGISEGFSTTAPISLYGATKLSSEVLALEYGRTFKFPVWIDRCGVLAGPGQFGIAEQGIFSFWVHAWQSNLPLSYIGFDGHGLQVRDALHPSDLATLVAAQLGDSDPQKTDRIWNVGGGLPNAMSLAELSIWCSDRFAPRVVNQNLEPRPFDLPWIVMDGALAQSRWGWQPAMRLEQILSEIADHAEQNPEWLKLCGVRRSL
ncbi:MAG: CDP-paratose 2-epimerase [Verrucomicrobiota bacterium]|jgi:CDP-paratose 2-epimerase|nr:CDP-paratose 2-epimerase [Verrucomicrobiota bacterium]